MENLEKSLVEKNLQKSGSLVVSERDTNVIQTNSTDDKGGFVFAPSKKQTYNIEELKKTLDVNVEELIPESEEELLDLVPRPIYEDALDALAIANQTIEEQSVTITELETTVSTLQSKISELEVTLDSEKLLRITAETSAENIRQQFALINESSQTAFQRATLEGIERAAFAARNEALNAQINAQKEQIKTLNNTINSLQRRIEEDVIRKQYLSGPQGSFERSGDIGWKIANYIGGQFSAPMYGTFEEEKNTIPNGRIVVFYNFSNRERTLNITKSGKWANYGNFKWPSNTIKIPARNGDIPGATSVTWGHSRPGGYKEDQFSEYRTNNKINLLIKSEQDTLNNLYYEWVRNFKVNENADDNPNNQNTLIETGVDRG